MDVAGFLDLADDAEANELCDAIREIVKSKTMTNATVIVALSLLVAELLDGRAARTEPILTVLNHLSVKFSNEMKEMVN